MLKIAIIGLLTLAALYAQAAEERFVVNGKEVNSKVEAIKALIMDPKTDVERCTKVELTNKATLRNK